jgi:hypothetical protein
VPAGAAAGQGQEQAAQQQPRRISITFYRNGVFTVNDGEPLLEKALSPLHSFSSCLTSRLRATQSIKLARDLTSCRLASRSGQALGQRNTLLVKSYVLLFDECLISWRFQTPPR